MKANCAVFSNGHPFSAVRSAPFLLLIGVLASFGQTGKYTYTGSKTNIMLNPGLYKIIAYGAQGGDYLWYPPRQLYGGLGAEVEGEFNFTNVTTLTLLVGGTGGAAADYEGGGGGGGSFVVNVTTPLVIAGGGGAAADAQALFNPIGGPGLTGGNGGDGADGDGSTGGSGGSGGSGGGAGSGNGSDGSGGGGYISNGGDGGGGVAHIGGKSYLNGGAGGAGDFPGGQGGYGGGGGGGEGGGGGGSLSGGGGGGSYIDSSAIAVLTEISGIASPDDSPNGEIIITSVQPPLCISESGNAVTVYWPAVPGWSLQQNTNLADPSGWSASSGTNTVNGTNYLSITAPTGSLFFRLQGQ